MLSLLINPAQAQPQPQPAPAPHGGPLNLATVLAEVYPQLGASGASDLVFWSQDELYRWLDEATERLARRVALFAEYNTSLTAGLANGSYGLPAGHVATLQCDLGGKVLRARTVHELEALDASWPTAVGPPVAFAQDSQGLQLLLLYPAPDGGSAGQTIGLLRRYVPSTVNLGNALAAVPTVLWEYFAFYAIAEARAAETKAAMPETASWFRGVLGMLEDTMRQYWGTAE